MPSDQVSDQQPLLSVGPLSVGIVGATGMVGELMRSILAERNFPVGSLKELGWHEEVFGKPGPAERSKKAKGL